MVVWKITFKLSSLLTLNNNSVQFLKSNRNILEESCGFCSSLPCTNSCHSISFQLYMYVNFGNLEFFESTETRTKLANIKFCKAFQVFESDEAMKPIA